MESGPPPQDVEISLNPTLSRPLSLRARKAVLTLAILIYLPLYVAAAVLIGDRLNGQFFLIPLGFYVLAGIVWVFPLKPLVDWTLRGRQTP